MKTYFEIVAGKSYRQLTIAEKEAIQDRQTALVTAWQDEKNELKRRVIEDELVASVQGLIKGIAHKQAEKSFSMDQEEFEGIISLTFAETLVKFDRTLNKPFQPVFIMNVRYAILETYREKGYDLHDTADRLDKRVSTSSQFHSDTDVTLSTSGELTPQKSNPIDTVFLDVLTEEILTSTFGDNDVKRTIVHMFLQDFKRNEIVSAINVNGKSPDAVAKQINRTIKQFKEAYLSFVQPQTV